MDRLDTTETPEKDALLRYDIRLLGRILGDTVRAQEGEEVFELVEHIRRSGVQFHRDADEGARHELQAIMAGLPTDRALRIIRAFGYFSHLANLAEDQHHIRRTSAYAMAQASARAGWPVSRVSSAAITRATVSVAVPGPNGAIMWIGRLGKSCAVAGNAAAHANVTNR